MEHNLILHIPHASPHIPCFEGFILSQSEIEQEVQQLTDWYTDELFQHRQATAIKAGFSRVFCDVERFEDDSLEIMASCGMGVLYSHTDDGRELREVSSGHRQRILRDYYFPHHQALERAVEASLDSAGKAIIVDCHSFPGKPFRRDLDQTPNRPDINIGSDPNHTGEELVTLTERFFVAKGLTVEINRPYSGTIVPSSFYGKTQKVQSIMIEVNRKLYLHEGTNIKNEQFNSMQILIREYLKVIQRLTE